MKQLIESFGEMAKLSKEAEALFVQSIVKKEFKKKELLQEEGKMCNNLFFVEKGVARTFYYKNGKEITYWLAAENDFVGAMASFFSRTPANKHVETLEDCTLWVFDYNKLEEVYAKSKELERMGRLFVSYGFSVLEKKFDDFHSMNSKERYEMLTSNHPQILQRVSLGIISSYLGITQETLSRIRAQK